MPRLSPDLYVAAIEASTAGPAEILAEHDQSLPISACPEWTLRQLVTHAGRAHRWAAEITRTRSAVFVPFREVPDGRLPDDSAEQRGRLRSVATTGPALGRRTQLVPPGPSASMRVSWRKSYRLSPGRPASTSTPA
jgi:hypothetical protein